MIQLPDAPWIRETEMTGYCRSGWWNMPPEEDPDDFDDFEGDEDE